jgi:broad specificity phosphatase PhoE
MHPAASPGLDARCGAFEDRSVALLQIGSMMTRTARYLTHPQVLIDPGVEITRWSLSDVGLARARALAADPGQLSGTRRVISSGETKAIETARPLAAALGVDLELRPRMHENDRSATGFLPPPEFEAVADAFFANPSQSVRGWETAEAAQRRIVEEVDACLTGHREGDVLFVGHGGVGTLLFCALSGMAIDRRFDQGPGGGGCWFQFDIDQRRASRGWQPMETLMSASAR